MPPTSRSGCTSPASYGVVVRFTLLRSFAEHRAVDGETRSAVVRSNVVFSLLYLNNNLHHTHHARPRLAWYSLPRARDELGSDEIAARGAGSYRGYADIARRYLLRPIDHPAMAPIAAPPPIAGASVRRRSARLTPVGDELHRLAGQPRSSTR